MTYETPSGSKHLKRESLTKHGQNAKKHRRCRDKCVVTVKSGSINQAFMLQYAAAHSAQEAELTIKFNTVCTIAKDELTLTKFKPMLFLMKMNGDI